MCKFSDLKDKIIKEINIDYSVHESSIKFTIDDGTKFKLTCFQDYEKNVWLEDVYGNLKHIIDSPILLAEETSEEYNNILWTTYKLSTVNGCFSFEWCGDIESVYSIDIEFFKV